MAEGLLEYKALDEADEYDAWAKKMELWFIYMGLDDLINGEWTCPEQVAGRRSRCRNNEAERFRTANKKGIAAVRNCLGPGPNLKVNHLKTAYEMWQELQTLYQPKATEKVRQMLNDMLLTTSLVSRESKHMQISSENFKTKPVLIEIILRGLGGEFDDFATLLRRNYDIDTTNFIPSCDFDSIVCCAIECEKRGLMTPPGVIKTISSTKAKLNQRREQRRGQKCYHTNHIEVAYFMRDSKPTSNNQDIDTKAKNSSTRCFKAVSSGSTGSPSTANSCQTTPPTYGDTPKLPQPKQEPEFDFNAPLAPNHASLAPTQKNVDTASNAGGRIFRFSNIPPYELLNEVIPVPSTADSGPPILSETRRKRLRIDSPSTSSDSSRQAPPWPPRAIKLIPISSNSSRQASPVPLRKYVPIIPFPSSSLESSPEAFAGPCGA